MDLAGRLCVSGIHPHSGMEDTPRPAAWQSYRVFAPRGAEDAGTLAINWT